MGGDVYSKKYGHGGYKVVGIYNPTRKSYRIHILVAKTFLGDPPNKNMIVNHKDLNKLNNHVDNLEYITQSENRQHFFDNTHHLRKNVEQRTLEGEIVKVYESACLASKKTGFGRDYITRCCGGGRKTSNGYKWRYV